MSLLRFTEVAVVAHRYSVVQLMIGVLFVALALLCMKSLRAAKAKKGTGEQQ
jgi:hypothetical protein